MIGLIMCGGKGSRMKSSEEKLLLKYKKPIIQHVVTALQESGCFSKIVCATSPNAPKTKEFVNTLGISVIETEGNGYVDDLRKSLLNLDDLVFVTSGDLVLLDAEIIKKIIGLVNEAPWTVVLVSKKFLDSQGIKPEYLVTYNNEEYAYTGVSIVNPKNISEMNETKESYIIVDDKRIAINLNTKKDYELLCAT